MARLALAVVLCFIAVSYAAVQTLQNTQVTPFHVVARQGMSALDMQRETAARSTKRAAAKHYLAPDDLKRVYNMSTDMNAGAGKTIALICGYGVPPNLEADLNVFASHYGLPACTTANGCFKLVNETGGNVFNTAIDSTWALEMALDIQMAHAVAPGAKKILVVGFTSFTDKMLNAINWAMKHADYISNSWGTPDPGWESTVEGELGLNTSVSLFAATGDKGALVQWPAVSNFVVAVGGTSVFLNSDLTLAYETAWSGSAGGCSTKFNGTVTQYGFSGYIAANMTALNCSSRARVVPDVAMVGDPQSGVYIYNSYGCNVTSPKGCFAAIGGTSAASPIFAARAAVVGKVVNHAYVYGNNIAFRDIISGNNINAAGFGYQAVVGFDLVTGRGTWTDPNLVQTSTTAGQIASTSTAAAATTTAKAASTSTSAAAATTAKAASTTTAASGSTTTAKASSTSATAAPFTTDNGASSSTGADESSTSTNGVVLTSAGATVFPHLFIVFCGALFYCFL